MSQFFDDLARTLATSMPRQRAVRVLGGALVSIAVPGIAARKAHAASSFHDCAAKGGLLCECNCKGAVCQRICCTPREDYECYCGPVEYGAECRKKPCGKPCGGTTCCKSDEFCANPLLNLCCKDEERGCGPVCCKPNEECRTARFGTGSQKVCEKKCPQGQAWCGSGKCCPPRWRCANERTGLCKRCRKNEDECGTKCCNRSTSRCCRNSRNSYCCQKGRDCCIVNGSGVCCPSRTKCTSQILPGQTGLTPGSPRVCCPPERQVPGATTLCCPPGQVSLGGKLVVGPGIPGLCCPRSQVCGSGSGITCCATGLTGTQTCCRGKCVDMQFDAQNCGNCGNVCPSGICSGGVCALP